MMQTRTKTDGGMLLCNFDIRAKKKEKPSSLCYSSVDILPVLIVTFK